MPTRRAVLQISLVMLCRGMGRRADWPGTGASPARHLRSRSSISRGGTSAPPPSAAASTTSRRCASNPSIIFVGTASGGVFKTVNNGVTWTAGLRPRRHVAVDRRHRDRAVRSEHHLGGHGRAEQPPELVVGRRRLQVGRRRRDLDAHGAARDRITSAASSSIRRIPTSCIVAALGHLWGPNAERGLYRTKDGGKTWQQRADDRRRHRRRRRRDRSGRPHALRRGLPATAARVGLRRRRTGQRPVSLVRRRRHLGEARRRACRAARRPHRRRHLAAATRTSSTPSSSTRRRRHLPLRRSRHDLDAAEPSQPAAELLQPDPHRSDESRQGLELARSFASRSTPARRCAATTPADRIHVDHHALWINPEQSRPPDARQRRRPLFLVRRQPELGLHRQPADRPVLRHRRRRPRSVLDLRRHAGQRHVGAFRAGPTACSGSPTPTW